MDLVNTIFLHILEALCGPHHAFLDIDVFAVAVLVLVQLANDDCTG